MPVTLKLYENFKQCATPPPTNVFLPTCSATAIPDYFEAVQSFSQYVTFSKDPTIRALYQLNTEGSIEDKENLLEALERINSPWYQVGKSMRATFFRLMGWKDKIDPDILLAEKLYEKKAEMSDILDQYHELLAEFRDIHIDQIGAAYLEGCERNIFTSDQALHFMANFEYMEGRTVDTTPDEVKALKALQKAMEIVTINDDEVNQRDLDKNKTTSRQSMG